MKPYRNRILYIALSLILIFGAMYFRLDVMIRKNGDAYSERAATKSTKSITLYGMRGTIYDTNMVPLAYDRLSYNVTFYRDPSRASEAERRNYTNVLIKTIQLIESNGKSTVDSFWLKKNEQGQWVFSSGSTSEKVEETRKSQWSRNFYLTSVPEEDWFEELCKKYCIPEGLDEALIVKVLSLWQESRMNAFNSTPVTIAYDVGFETMSEIEVHSMELTGIDIVESSSRVYPQGKTACHTIGYISKINAEQLENYRSQGYPNDAFVGASGIESSLEDQLSPYIQYRQGKRQVEIDTRGKVVRELSYTPPTDGNSVVLTLDVDMQKVMANALEKTIKHIHQLQEEEIAKDRWKRHNETTLKEYKEKDREIALASSGAMVAMDPHSGRILGMVSYPDFNLSYFDGGIISASEWNEVLDGNDPLYNRAISTKDSPGSIFKLCTALAGLSEGAITVDTIINDDGLFDITDKAHPAKCWTSEPQKHQHQTVVEGLKNSCNYFFYTVGYKLGVKNIYKWAAALGLTSKTNIELPGETTSFVGNQDMLYDPSYAISEQYTYKPMLAANAIRSKILAIGAERNIEYDQERIDEVVKKMLDIAVSYDTKEEWNKPIREILLYDLNLPLNYIVGNYLGNTFVSYIQELFWTPNETIMLAIGQSITQTSPIAIARYVSAIANGGTVYDAQIIDKIIAPDGEVVLEKQPVIANQIKTEELYFAKIKRGMEEVTSAEDGGTAAAYFEGIDYIAAKTGTSQRTDLDVENNAWIVSYAPKEDPQIVVIAYIQNGFQGAYASEAIIPTIKYYLESQGYSESTEIGVEFKVAD